VHSRVMEQSRIADIPTARGDGEWTATQVARVLERI
jgi:hypothetical protein